MKARVKQANTTGSSKVESEFCGVCGLKDDTCQGLGVVRYEVPVDDSRFGKLFRCPNNPAEADEALKQRKRQMSNLTAYADKTFDSFNTEIGGYDSKHQHNLKVALRQAYDFAIEPEGWMLFTGTYGTGKTHLAAAIGNHRLEQGDAVMFTTVPDLLDHLRASFGYSSEGGYDETFTRMRNVDLLILDDLGVENPSPWAQEKLFQLLDHRYSHRLKTVVTTNQELEDIDPRIRSRVMDNFISRMTLIDAPDFRTQQTLTNQSELDELMDLRRYNHMRFGNFEIVATDSESERRNLHRAITITEEYTEDVLIRMSDERPWLLLRGSHGSGKTHLAAAIANEYQIEGRRAIILSVSDLLDYIRKAYDPRSKTSFDERFKMIRQSELLVLEDLGGENATPWAQEKLFQIIDFRYLERLPTVFTSAVPFENLGSRLRSRLLDQRMCRLFELRVASYADRRHRDLRQQRE